MDARIILGGRSPDFANAFGRGLQLAEGQNALNEQNALRRLYQEQGPGIAAGNPNALSALARYRPDMAMDMRMQQEEMTMRRDDRAQALQISRERLNMEREQARMAAQEYAAQLSAEERQAQAADIEKAITGAVMLYRNGDRAGYEAWLRQEGLDPAAFPFEQFPAVAAKFIGLSEALKATEQPAGPEWAAATPEQAAAYGAAGGQINTRTGEFKPINPPSGMSLQTNPDGTMTMVQGPGAGARFTEAQSKDNVFATRAEGALQVLEPVADALASRPDVMLDMVPLGIGREVQGDRYQVARQAGDEFLQAILRKDTGAAITEQEQRLYGDTFLPRPGDGPAVIAAKRESRIRALEAIRAGMNIQQITATEKALVEAARRTGEAPAADDDEALMRRLLGGE